MLVRFRDRPFGTFAVALAGLGLLGVVLFTIGAVRENGLKDSYLLWNLFLAWIPLVLAYVLVRRLRRMAWSSWSGIALSLSWLLFLPNSFYLVSDYIHLEDIARTNVLFDALTFTVFILNGLIMGFASLYMLQAELRKRFGIWRSELFAGAVLLLCSFAIYLGRELRWNSWDVLLSPAGLLFDVSERIIDPLAHPTAFSTTGMFFLFLGGLYWALRAMVQAIGAYARAGKNWP